MGILRAVTLSTSALLLSISIGSGAVAAADSPATFRMIVGEPRFLDPNLTSDYSIYVAAQLFEPLARLDGNGNLILLQAEGIEVGPDGRTWTIKLNPKNKWSDGQPVTAADWEYSWKRILDPKIASELAVYLSDVENADDYNKGKIIDAGKVGIRAIDEYTLQVVTAKVAPYFRAKLALPYLTPVPASIVQKFGDKWIAPENIASNGPYRLVSRINDQSIVMEANPYYGGSKPAIPRIEMTTASGDLCTAQLRAYEADEVDLATCVPTQDIPRVRASSALSEQLSCRLAVNRKNATIWL